MCGDDESCYMFIMYFFFFKQKTAYEVRVSDWSSDVCSSDLDNMKTAVTSVFTGKERVFNRRFLIMTDHYMVEPTACSPAAGWEKGQVENQVQTIRGRFFQPRLRFASLDELNGWLEAECRRWA